MKQKRKNIYDRLFWQLKKDPSAKRSYFVFPVFFLFCELCLRLFTGTPLFRNILWIALADIGVGFLLQSVLMVFGKKVYGLGSLLIIICTTTFYIVECLIHKSFNMFMSPATILHEMSDVAGHYAVDSVLAIFKNIHIILIFLIPLIIYIVCHRYLVPHKRIKGIVIPGVFIILSVFLLLISGVALRLGKDKDKMDAHYNFSSAVEVFGLNRTIMLDIRHKTSSETELIIPETEVPDINKDTETFDEQEEDNSIKYNVMDIDFAELAQKETDGTFASMDLYVNAQTPSLQNAYTGLFKGKNLILICAESFSKAGIRKDLTPTLYRMVHNGIYFSDYYQPSWGGSTSTGEVSEVLGIIPVDNTDTILETEENNNYFTLGNQLQREGYYSIAYHSGEYDYYDRDLTHENLGYSTYLGLGNGLENITGEWPRDEILFRETLKTYIDKSPFSIYYMTLSGHMPYDSESLSAWVYEDDVRAVMGDDYNEDVIYYECSMMDIDRALKVMIEMLEEKGIADDTVICLTADHYPYGLLNVYSNSLSQLYGHGYDYPWQRDENAWILWSGCLENELKDMAIEVSAPTSSLDIVPTLSNLFGLKYDSRLLVGRDVFSEAEPMVCWIDGSWATDRGLYDAYDGEYIPREGYSYDSSYISRMSDIVKNKITYSRNVVRKDYWGHLFGEDNNN